MTGRVVARAKKSSSHAGEKKKKKAPRQEDSSRMERSRCAPPSKAVQIVASRRLGSAGFLARFDWIRELGRGASGEVWLVRRKSDYQMLALKSLPLPPLASQDERSMAARRQALREVEVLHGLESPHVVRYAETIFVPASEERHQSVVNILTEHCDAGDLSRYIKRAYTDRQLPEKIVRGFASGILAGLVDLHKRNVLHRDLKPSNIFLKRAANTARSHRLNVERAVSGFQVLVGDLGLARAVTSAEPMASTVVGTPHYTAPEIWEGKLYSEKADIYSFGVCIYELMHGKPPYGEVDNVAALVRRVLRLGEVLEENTTTMEEDAIYMDPKYSDCLRGIVVECLQKNPDLRPSAQELQLRFRSLTEELDPHQEVRQVSNPVQDHEEEQKKELDPHQEVRQVSNPVQDHEEQQKQAPERDELQSVGQPQEAKYEEKQEVEWKTGRLEDQKQESSTQEQDKKKNEKKDEPEQQEQRDQQEQGRAPIQQQENEELKVEQKLGQQKEKEELKVEQKLGQQKELKHEQQPEQDEVPDQKQGKKQNEVPDQKQGKKQDPKQHATSTSVHGKPSASLGLYVFKPAARGRNSLVAIDTELPPGLPEAVSAPVLRQVASQPASPALKEAVSTPALHHKACPVLPEAFATALQQPAVPLAASTRQCSDTPAGSADREVHACGVSPPIVEPLATSCITETESSISSISKTGQLNMFETDYFTIYPTLEFQLESKPQRNPEPDWAPGISGGPGTGTPALGKGKAISPASAVSVSKSEVTPPEPQTDGAATIALPNESISVNMNSNSVADAQSLLPGKSVESMSVNVALAAGVSKAAPVQCANVGIQRRAGAFAPSPRRSPLGAAVASAAQDCWDKWHKKKPQGAPKGVLAEKQNTLGLEIVGKTSTRTPRPARKGMIRSPVNQI